MESVYRLMAPSVRGLLENVIWILNACRKYGCVSGVL